MGRTTPSLRILVGDYVARLRKIAEMLPAGERAVLEAYLEDIESTLSITMHTGVVDPIEVLLLHLLRRLRDICECREH